MIKILGLIALLVSYISFGYYGYSLAEVGNFHFSLVPIVCYLFVFVLGLVTNIVKVRTLNKIKQKGLNNGIKKKDLIKYGKYKEMNFMFNQMFVSVMPFAISTLISVFFSGFKSGLLLLYMAVAVVVAIISKVFDNMTSYDLADIKNRVDYKIKNKDK